MPSIEHYLLYFLIGFVSFTVTYQLTKKPFRRWMDRRVKPKVDTLFVVDPDYHRLVEKRTWLGQGYCSVCGREYITETYHRGALFDAFTGEKRLPELTIIGCPDIVGRGGPTSPRFMLDFPNEELRRSHDWWVRKP